MAPKKGNGGRSAGSKTPAPTVPGSDHIMFTNKVNNDSKDRPERDEKFAPPQPDARTIIGGPSWTGKLPVNILSELCQKQKWNKPEYSIRKLTDTPEGGYLGSVFLSKTDAKTRKVTKLAPFLPPLSHRALASQATSLEARHFAATYAMFRFASMKNIHMTLPPTYRDLWKGDFALLKQDDTKAGRAWMYDADPFATAVESKKIHQAIDLRRTQAAETRAASSHVQTHPGSKGKRSLPKAWERASRLEMGNKIRSKVEELVKQHSAWNGYCITLTNSEHKKIVSELTELGFRPSHVEEAIQQCKDREETLHWLLIHVPEDDLPPWSFPENYTSGISLASGDFAKESKIKRLALAGYSSDDCVSALQRCDGDEIAAAQELQYNLVGTIVDNSAVEPDNCAHLWQEETETLDAIFGDRFSSKTTNVCVIQAELGAVKMLLQFNRPRGNYPQTCLPVVAVHSKDLPAYIRLSTVRRCLKFAAESLLGGPMVFNMIEWIESNLPDILNDPGPLRDISLYKEEWETAVIGQPTRQPTAVLGRQGHYQPRQLKIRSNAELKAASESRKRTSQQQKMLLGRQSLPAWDMQQDIVRAVRAHQCVIIQGETGSGKSTQSVQFVLDAMIDNLEASTTNIVCTQPRRISALGLADRVSDERCSSVGEEVGYVIRGDARVGPGTKVTFMTTGVLLRRMQSSQDPVQALAEISHLFIDEVHERSVDTDFLLALLRDVMQVRPGLKVILMSATLDADVFTSYFGGPQRVGQVHIPGRTYPVCDYYLDDILKLSTGSGWAGSALDGEEEGDDEAQPEMEDASLGRSIQKLGMGVNYNLLAKLVTQIDAELGGDPGGILIFLSGTLEIDRCLRALRHIGGLHALPLNASLTPTEQRKVFIPSPKGMRKVIASTNVAETSITIADIVAVIDTGRVKETSYDVGNSIVRLEEVWASQAACKQRRGRAGRVQAGKCYKMFTRQVEGRMAATPQPEIRRLPLEQLCLSVKATATKRDVAKFLQQTLTPPKDEAIDAAMILLHRVGALDNNELTALGRHLAMIPADLRCAKLLVYGSIFGCLEACLTIAAILTVKSPFVSPKDKREETKLARSTYSTEDGDLILELNAFSEWFDQSRSLSSSGLRAWCSERFLSLQTLRDISSTRSQLLSSLANASIVPLDYDVSSIKFTALNKDNDNTSLLRALIAGALNPQIAHIEFPSKKFAASMAGAVEMDPEAKMIKYFNQENGRVFVHPSSVLFDAQTFSGSASYISYFTKLATSKNFVRDLTPFNAYGLSLFGGPVTLETHGHGLMVDGWLPLRGWARIGVLVSRLRALLDQVLRKRIDQPSTCLDEEDDVIGIVRRLVQFNGQDQ